MNELKTAMASVVSPNT